MKKVYCKNCRWYPVWWWNKQNVWHWGIRCYPIRGKTKKKILYKWLGKTVIEKKTHYGRSGKFCDDTNMVNDCSDYERKWWKVWMR